MIKQKQIVSPKSFKLIRYYNKEYAVEFFKTHEEAKRRILELNEWADTIDADNSALDYLEFYEDSEMIYTQGTKP